MSKVREVKSIETYAQQIREELKMFPESFPIPILENIEEQITDIIGTDEPNTVHQFQQLSALHGMAMELLVDFEEERDLNTKSEDPGNHYEIPGNGWATDSNVDRLIRGRLAENPNIQPIDTGYNTIGDNIKEARPVIVHSPVHIRTLGAALETSYDLPLEAQIKVQTEDSPRKTVDFSNLKLQPIFIPVNVGGSAERGGNHWVSVYLEPVNDTPTFGEARPQYRMVFFDPMAQAVGEALTYHGQTAFAQLNEHFNIVEARDMSNGKQHQSDKGHGGAWSCGYWSVEFAERVSAPGAGYHIPTPLMPRTLKGITEERSDKAAIREAYQTELIGYQGKGLIHSPGASKRPSLSSSKETVDNTSKESSLEGSPRTSDEFFDKTSDTSSSPLLTPKASPARGQANDPAITLITNDIVQYAFDLIYLDKEMAVPDVAVPQINPKKGTETYIAEAITHARVNIATKLAESRSEKPLSEETKQEVAAGLAEQLAPAFTFTKKKAGTSLSVKRDNMRQALNSMQRHVESLDVDAIEERITKEKEAVEQAKLKELDRLEELRQAEVERNKTPQERWETSKAREMEQNMLQHEESSAHKPTQIFLLSEDKKALVIKARPFDATNGANEAAHYESVRNEQLQQVLETTLATGYAPRAVALSAVLQASKDSNTQLTQEQTNQLVDTLTTAVDELYKEAKNHVFIFNEAEVEISATPGNLAYELSNALATSFHASQENGGGIDIEAALIQTKQPLQAHIAKTVHNDKKRPDVFTRVVESAHLPAGEPIAVERPLPLPPEHAFNGLSDNQIRQVNDFVQNALTEDALKRENLTSEHVIKALAFVANPATPSSAKKFFPVMDGIGSREVSTSSYPLQMEVSKYFGGDIRTGQRGDVSLIRPLTEFLSRSPNLEEAIEQVQETLREKVESLPKVSFKEDRPKKSNSNEAMFAGLFGSLRSDGIFDDIEERKQQLANHLNINPSAMIDAPDKDGVIIAVTNENRAHVLQTLRQLSIDSEDSITVAPDDTIHINDSQLTTICMFLPSQSGRNRAATLEELLTDTLHKQEESELSVNEEVDPFDTILAELDDFTPIGTDTLKGGFGGRLPSPPSGSSISEQNLDELSETDYDELSDVTDYVDASEVDVMLHIDLPEVRSIKGEDPLEQNKTLDKAMQDFVAAVDSRTKDPSNENKAAQNKIIDSAIHRISVSIGMSGTDMSPYENLFDTLVAESERMARESHQERVAKAQEALDKAQKDKKKTLKRHKPSKKDIVELQQKLDTAKKSPAIPPREGAQLTRLAAQLEEHCDYISQETYRVRKSAFETQAVALKNEGNQTPESRFVLNQAAKNGSSLGVPSEVRGVYLRIGEEWLQSLKPSVDSEVSTDSEVSALESPVNQVDQWKQEVAATYDAVMERDIERLEQGELPTLSSVNPYPLTISTSTKVAVLGNSTGNEGGFKRMKEEKAPQALHAEGIENEEVITSFVERLADRNPTLIAMLSDPEHSMRVGSNHLIRQGAQAYQNLGESYFDDLETQLHHQTEASRFLLNAAKEMKSTDDVASWFNKNQPQLDAFEETILQDLETNYTHHTHHVASAPAANKALDDVKARQTALQEQRVVPDIVPPKKHIRFEDKEEQQEEMLAAPLNEGERRTIQDGLISSLEENGHLDPMIFVNASGNNDTIQILAANGKPADKVQEQLQSAHIEGVLPVRATNHTTYTLSAEQARQLHSTLAVEDMGLGLPRNTNGNPPPKPPKPTRLTTTTQQQRDLTGTDPDAVLPSSHVNLADLSDLDGFGFDRNDTESWTDTSHIYDSDSEFDEDEQDLNLDDIFGPPDREGDELSDLEELLVDTQPRENVVDLTLEDIVDVDTQTQDRSAGRNPLLDIGTQIQDGTLDQSSDRQPPRRRNYPPVPESMRNQSRTPGSPGNLSTTRDGSSPNLSSPPTLEDELRVRKEELRRLQQELEEKQTKQAERQARLRELSEKHDKYENKEKEHKGQGNINIGGNIAVGIIGLIAFAFNPFAGLAIWGIGFAAVNAKPLYHQTKESIAHGNKKSLEGPIKSVKRNIDTHTPEIEKLMKQEKSLENEITDLNKTIRDEKANALARSQNQAQQSGLPGIQVGNASDVTAQNHLPGSPQHNARQNPLSGTPQSHLDRTQQHRRNAQPPKPFRPFPMQTGHNPGGTPGGAPMPPYYTSSHYTDRHQPPVFSPYAYPHTQGLSQNGGQHAVGVY